MSYLTEPEPAPNSPILAGLRHDFGFVPNLFREQMLLPRAVAAEALFARAVMLQLGHLSREQKETLLLVAAKARANTYCLMTHYQILRSLGVADDYLKQIMTDYHRAGMTSSDVALLDFGLKLTKCPTRIANGDVARLHRHGFTDEKILEAILAVALAGFLCVLSEGLGVTLDFEPKSNFTEPPVFADSPERFEPIAHGDAGPYLRTASLDPNSFEPFRFFQQKFGFVPNLFRAQTLRPDVIEAEAAMVDAVLFTEDVLDRTRKEYILLVISAANLNTYCVAVHSEMLRALGVSAETSDKIVLDHPRAGLSGPDTALLDFAWKLTRQPLEVRREDIELLKKHGFSEAQVLESIIMAALTNFLNTLQMGLGTTPDVNPRHHFSGRGLLAEPVKAPGDESGLGPNPTASSPRLTDSRVSGRPTQGALSADPDAVLVSRIQTGDLEAFELLVRRHQQRIFRVIVGVVGNIEDAADCTQNTFVNAFKHIKSFRGAARFSTWVTRIAINEGIQFLRTRKAQDSLEESETDHSGHFKPQQFAVWDDDPEDLYSRKELRELVERELRKLPPKYRVVVMLRDIEGLSTEEAARVLGLHVAALKARLLRGRLMLREALAPYFSTTGATAVC